MRRHCVLCADELPDGDTPTIMDKKGNLHNVCKDCHMSNCHHIVHGTAMIAGALIDAIRQDHESECPCARMDKYYGDTRPQEE